MVGTSYLDDRILPEYQAAYDTVPVLAKEYPSYESLLAVEPDFVYGGWDSAFDEKEGRGRQRLTDAGVLTTGTTFPSTAHVRLASVTSSATVILSVADQRVQCATSGTGRNGPPCSARRRMPCA